MSIAASLAADLEQIMGLWQAITCQSTAANGIQAVLLAQSDIQWKYILKVEGAL